MASRPRLTGVAYAAAAYAVFLAAAGWAVTFLADLQLPRGIDRGPRHSAVVAVWVDLMLLLLFAVQHSMMARSGFKQWLARRMPAPLERSTYVLTASLVLLLLFWQWQAVGGVIWDLHGGAAVAIWFVFGSGWVVAVGSTFMIDHLDFLGLRKAYRHAKQLPDAPPPFRERWLYAWIRHPIMLGFLLAFWATPRLTGGHLLFATAASAYIVVGVRFEERDLARQLGDVYRDYAERVPAILPLRRPA